MAAVSPTASSPTASTTPLATPAPGVGTFPSVSLGKEFVKVRWFEENVPEAVNRRWIGMPRGIYLGFIPTTTTGSRILKLETDPGQNFSLLRVPSSDDRVMVDIFSGTDLEIDFSGHNVWPVYVLASSTFRARTQTQGKIFTRASNVVGIDEVVICKVDKVGNNLVIDTTEPTNRHQPLAFNSQPYGYMPTSAIDDLAATNATVAEVIAARSSSYTGPHSTLGTRLNADMAGDAMADRLGLRLVHLISNNHPNRSGISVNVSGSFSETGRQIAPQLTITAGGDESTEGAITSGVRNICFFVNGSTGQRLIDETTRESVYGRLTFSSASIGGGKTVNYVNASTSVNGGGSNPFTAPLEAGDLLEGPDGLFYEIVTITDPDNAVLGSAYRGVDAPILNPTFRRWLALLFTVTGGAFNLATPTPVQFVFPGFFRLDRAIFDGLLLLKKDGERPQLPIATSAVPGKALLAADGGLVGSFRTIKDAGSSVGSDIHTLNFAFGGATNAGGGIANVAVAGAQGATGPGANQGPQGNSGPAGFGYSLQNTFEAGPESADTITAPAGPKSESFTHDWTAPSSTPTLTTGPLLVPPQARAYAHVTGGWSVINGFQPLGYERIHIDGLTNVDDKRTRIDYRIQPDPFTSNTTIQCFMGASQ